MYLFSGNYLLLFIYAVYFLFSSFRFSIFCFFSPLREQTQRRLWTKNRVPLTLLLLVILFFTIMLLFSTQGKPIADKVFCLCHICCVCCVSKIFPNHYIKLFWCLTVVVGLIKLYYIKIFVFLNLCLTEHWSIYLLVCAYCACVALFGFEI